MYEEIGRVARVGEDVARMLRENCSRGIPALLVVWRTVHRGAGRSKAGERSRRRVRRCGDDVTKAAAKIKTIGGENYDAIRLRASSAIPEDRPVCRPADSRPQ